MFAVIETGGKQYTVTPGQKMKVEKIEAQEGDVVVFDKVLLASDDKDVVHIGYPYLEGKKVQAKVLKQGRERKVIVFKFKSKTRQSKKKGHRQYSTQLEVISVE